MVLDILPALGICDLVITLQFVSLPVFSVAGTSSFSGLLDRVISFSDVDWVVDQSLLIVIFFSVRYFRKDFFCLLSFDNDWMLLCVHGLISLEFSGDGWHILFVL